MSRRAADTPMLVQLRDDSVAELQGRGIMGNILVGTFKGRDIRMSWHPSGRWRWDGADSPRDIVGGLPEPLPRNVVI